MKILKAASAMFCMAATAMVLVPGASAQETGNRNKWSKVTFSGPVEIPGVHLKGYSVLPGGTYVFRLADVQGNRHIVQIQNEDQSQTYATILAIPNTRLERTDETVITFRERPAGQPPALRAWFYPGSTWGDEFVYPKSKAQEMAKANNTPVYYSDDETSREVTEPIQAPTQEEARKMESATVGTFSPAGEEQELSAEVTPPPQPEEPAELAQNTPPANTPPPPPASQPMAEPSELPQTAGNSGLLLLGGLLALGGALSVRVARQHS
jgi:hypothetical protein